MNFYEFLLYVHPSVCARTDSNMYNNQNRYGEIFASTICGALDWCRMTNLPVGKNNGVGDKTQFCFSCQVPQNKLETELMRGCGSDTTESSTTDKSDNCPKRVSIWVHAVKWIREDGAVQNLLKIKWDLWIFPHVNHFPQLSYLIK